MALGSCFVRHGRVVVSFAVARRSGMENQNIGAFRELHPDGVIDSSRGVMFRELGTQSPGLDADHRVQLRVEIRLTPKYFSSNLVFLQGRSGMVEGVVGKIAKQFAQGFGAVQGLASN